MGKKVRDIAGQTFGKVTVISFANISKYGHSQWNTICECGTEKVIAGQNLTSGNTRSCGCIPKGKTAKEGVSREKVPREKVLEYKYPKRKVGRPSLPESVKQHIIDLYNEGLSYREIKQHINVSLRTISDTINGSRDKLTREQYTPYDNKKRKESV